MNFMSIEAIIQTFLDYVWRCENFLLFIVSDKDINFVAHFWKRFYKRLNITFKLFIAFHLETNKQIEIINTTFKQYLCVYINYNQNDWVNYLFTAKFVINNHANEFIKILFFLITKEYFSRSDLKIFESVQQKVFSNKRYQKKLIDKIVEKIKALRKYFRQKLTELKSNKQNILTIIDHLSQNSKSMTKFYWTFEISASHVRVVY